MQTRRREAFRIAADAQTRSTRHSLASAYRLAAEQELPRPTVTWLCAQADVGRSTFYTHFSAVSDVATFAIAEALDELAEREAQQRSDGLWDPRTNTLDGYARLAAALRESRGILDYAARTSSRALVVDNLTEMFAQFTRPTVADAYRDEDPDTIDLITEFITAGTARTFLRWLDNPEATSENVLVQLLTGLLPSRLAG